MGLGIENMVGIYKHRDCEQAENTQSVKRLGCVLEYRGFEIIQTSFDADTTSCSMVYGATFPRLKRLECEGSNSLLTSAGAEKECAVPTLTHVNSLHTQRHLYFVYVKPFTAQFV